MLQSLTGPFPQITAVVLLESAASGAKVIIVVVVFPLLPRGGRGEELCSNPSLPERLFLLL